MRKKSLLTISMLSAAALLVGGISSPAMADSSPAEDQLFVVTSGNESILDGIAAHAANDSEYRRAAIKLTDSWLTRLSEGQSIQGLNSSSVSTMSAVDQTDVISKLHSDLVSGNLPQTELFSPGKEKPSVRSARGVSALAVNPDNPNSYDVRGEAAIGYWTGMQLVNAGTLCSEPGCEETDRFTSNVTVDPGAVTTKVSATNSYFPDSGNFENKHFELWAINSGEYVGNSDTGNLPSSSVDYISSTKALNNSVLTTAVTQWVYVPAYEGYVADGAKTADAYCEPPGDNSCNY